MENKDFYFLSVRQVLDYVVHCCPCRQIYKDQLNRDDPSREPRSDNPALLWNVCMLMVARVRRAEGVTAEKWQAFEWRYLTKLAEPSERRNFSKGDLVRAIGDRLGVKKSAVYKWTNELLDIADQEAVKLLLIPPRGKYGT